MYSEESFPLKIRLFIYFLASEISRLSAEMHVVHVAARNSGSSFPRLPLQPNPTPLMLPEVSDTEISCRAVCLRSSLRSVKKKKMCAAEQR